MDSAPGLEYVAQRPNSKECMYSVYNTKTSHTGLYMLMHMYITSALYRYTFSDNTGLISLAISCECGNRINKISFVLMLPEIL